MHFSVVGSGYVSTTIVACFADFGHDIVNICKERGVDAYGRHRLRGANLVVSGTKIHRKVT